MIVCSIKVLHHTTIVFTTQLSLTFVVSDWRLALQMPELSHRMPDDDKKQQFYQKLKSSEEATGESSGQFTFQNYQPEKSTDRLREIFRSIEGQKRRHLELYAVMGAELAHIKCTYVSRRCDRCALNSDVYNISRCIVCSRTNNVKEYFDSVTTAIGYCKDYVNFFIRIATLCTQFPRLLSKSVSMDEMKRYLPYVAEKLEEEKDYWQTAV